MRLIRGRCLFQYWYPKVSYKRVALIRGNMILLGLGQLYFYCTFLILSYFLYYILLKCVILMIRAEICTLLLIHKINWDVSCIIFYAISNPKFLLTLPSKFFYKMQNYNNHFASFNNMTTLMNDSLTDI